MKNLIFTLFCLTILVGCNRHQNQQLAQSPPKPESTPVVEATPEAAPVSTPAPVATSTPPQPTAWGKTAWGMTVEQVQSLYPDSTNPGLTRPHDPKLEIKDFSIEGDSYKVGFFFDDAKGLQKIQVSRETKSEFDIKDSVKKLEELLTQKYGPPAVREKQEGEGEIGGFQLVWNQPNLVVKLSYSPFPSINDFLLYISYSKPKTEALDKL